MPHLRHCVSAGEPLNEEVIYNWEEATGIVIKGLLLPTMTVLGMSYIQPLGLFLPKTVVFPISSGNKNFPEEGEIVVLFSHFTQLFHVVPVLFFSCFIFSFL
jgi:acyl-coenzyme A synthetase/AMP-(fatty) acid ligase